MSITFTFLVSILINVCGLPSQNCLKVEKYTVKNLADWDSFRDLLRNALRNEILNLPIENCAIDFSSRVKASNDAFVPSWKYLVKTPLSHRPVLPL